MHLSPEQMKIVHHPADQHAVVLAVAGSGKSTTMAERIAYLVEALRVDPAHIIAMMFNKAASLELSEKLQKRLGKRNAPASVTYHRLGTLCLNWLIKAGKAEGWEFEASPTKAVYFTARLMEDMCHRHGHKWPNLVAEVFQGFVDRVKGDLCTPEEAWANGDWDARYEWFVDWYPTYERARQKAKRRFFSDLIYDPVAIMSNDPEAAAIVAGRFEHIIVDEYQDICESQQALLRFVAGKKARVMVVGDDDQTIYCWRGAKPSYILRDFYRDFPGAIIYKMTRTWRYGHALSCAANYVITGNTDRADKLCISGDNAPQTSLNLLQQPDDGAAVLKIINQRVYEGLALSEIAILVRAYSSSASAQFALLAAGIPFRFEGGDDVNVLNNTWVVGLLGWLELAAGLHARHPYAGEPDRAAIFQLRSFVNVPPNGNLSWEGTNELCRLLLQHPEDGKGFGLFINNSLAISDGTLADRLHRKRQLWRKLQQLTPKARSINAYDLLTELYTYLDIEGAITTGGRKQSQNNSDQDDEELQVVNAFMQYAAKQRTLKVPEFLQHISDLKSFSERAKVMTDAVHMTSLHRSKGLEWPCVIMVGLAQGRFPFQSKRRPIVGEKWDRHLEDERRLFYVGMTRAKRYLYLLAPVDLELNQWLKAGKTGHPELSMDGSRASQFLFESNLYLASLMSRMAHQPMAARAVDPELFNTYLATLGKDYSVGKVEG